jgi:hypothetical protein
MAKKRVNVKKEKSKEFKYNVLNVKLTSRKIITEKSYTDLFEKSFSQKKTGHIFGETYGIIRQLFGKKGSVPMHGMFCRYIRAGNQAMNIENLEIENFEIPKKYFLNPREVEFVFYPDLHRIGVPGNSAISLNSLKTMLEDLFKSVIDDSEKIEVIIEQSADGFNKIINAKQISKLHVEISPSNADINKDAVAFMDKELKNGDIERLVSDIRPNAKGQLNVEKSTVLQGMLGMARSNGFAKATIVNEHDKKEIVFTNKHPQKFPVTASNADDAKILLYNELKKKFRNE